MKPLWSMIKNLFRRKPTLDEILSDMDSLAVVVVDVQKEYCDPRGRRGLPTTHKIAKRIRGAIPAFKKIGLKIYPVYFAHKDQKLRDIDFFRYRPDFSDTLIRKNDDSAFKGSAIDRILQGDRKKSLLVCGFNLSACVKDTILDARRKGYNVIMMEDLTGNDADNFGEAGRAGDTRKMKRRGVHVRKSADILKALKSGFQR